jgi:succinyl-CoA synthetase beta subunit
MEGLNESKEEKVDEKIGIDGDRKDRKIDMLFRIYEMLVKKDEIIIEVNNYEEENEGNYL